MHVQDKALILVVTGSNCVFVFSVIGYPFILTLIKLIYSDVTIVHHTKLVFFSHNQVFHVPLEERKYKDLNQFGEGDQAKVCVDIMHKTGAHLELSLAKDQGLSIMVSGKLDAVMKARKEIVSRLQTQVRRSVFCPW